MRCDDAYRTSLYDVTVRGAAESATKCGDTTAFATKVLAAELARRAENARSRAEGAVKAKKTRATKTERVRSERGEVNGMY